MLLGIYWTELKTCARTKTCTQTYSSCIHTCPVLEATKISFKRLTDEQMVAHPDNGMLSETSKCYQVTKRHAAAAKSLQLCPTVGSVRPHRRQPTRLRLPQDSPGKNTGVGCHFFLQCVKVKSESEVAQSWLTLCDPMDCSPPGSSVHGIFQARVREWVAIALWLNKKLVWKGCLLYESNYMAFCKRQYYRNSEKKKKKLAARASTGRMWDGVINRWIHLGQ